MRNKIITICGSMRFSNDIMKIATELETEKGYCVLQPVYNTENKSFNDNELNNLVNAHLQKSMDGKMSLNNPTKHLRDYLAIQGVLLPDNIFRTNANPPNNAVSPVQVGGQNGV